MEFSTHHDHSKWAVGKAESAWICVGDINRAEHQKVRGGGTVCQKNIEIAKVYQQSVADVEQCPHNTKKKSFHRHHRRQHNIRHGN